MPYLNSSSGKTTTVQIPPAPLFFFTCFVALTAMRNFVKASELNKKGKSMWQVLVLVVWQKEKMRKKEPDYQADGSKHTTDRLIFLEFDSIGG
jgi:hypothetical protein